MPVTMPRGVRGDSRVEASSQCRNTAVQSLFFILPPLLNPVVSLYSVQECRQAVDLNNPQLPNRTPKFNSLLLFLFSPLPGFLPFSGENLGIILPYINSRLYIILYSPGVFLPLLRPPLHLGLLFSSQFALPLLPSEFSQSLLPNLRHLLLFSLARLLVVQQSILSGICTSPTNTHTRKQASKPGTKNVISD